MSVKSLWFKVRMCGRGIVNYDGKDARWTLKEYLSKIVSALGHDNVKVAKHSIRKVGMEDGKPKYEIKLKVSAACIRHSLFEADQPFHNPAIIHAPKILVKLISSVAGLLRGYMFECKGVVGIKRKSPVMITDAEQSNTTVPTFDIGTMSAPRTQKEDAEDVSGLTLHYKETICDVVYDFEGAIDLNLLQFISLSEMYDRLAVNPHYLQEYRTSLEKTLGSPAPEYAWYIYKTASNGLPEEGLLLSQEQVVVLVKEFFQRLCGMLITRGGGGYAKVEEVKVKHISNPIEDYSNDPAGYYTVKTPQDLRLKPEDVEIFYTKISEEDSKKMYDEINVAEKAQQDKNKTDKASKKKAKKAQAEKRAANDGVTL